MNRAELISAVSDATALPRAQVDATLSAVLDQIVAATAAGQKTTLTGFGSFQPMDRSARAGRNPGHRRSTANPGEPGRELQGGSHLQGAGRCFPSRRKEEECASGKGGTGVDASRRPESRSRHQAGSQEEGVRQEVAHPLSVVGRPDREGGLPVRSLVCSGLWLTVTPSNSLPTL